MAWIVGAIATQVDSDGLVREVLIVIPGLIAIICFVWGLVLIAWGILRG